MHKRGSADGEAWKDSVFPGVSQKTFSPLALIRQFITDIQAAVGKKLVESYVEISADRHIAGMGRKSLRQPPGSKVNAFDRRCRRQDRDAAIINFIARTIELVAVVGRLISNSWRQNIDDIPFA